MAMDTADKPGLDERYLGATNSSDLTLNPDGLCDATHLIAAGLLGNRMGQALIHLRSEWDAADKPRKATEAEIAARAAELPKRNAKPDLKRANTEMLVGYTVAKRHRAHSMQGWQPAITILREWALRRRVDPDLLSPALYHWLAPTCPVCDGRQFRTIPDTPALSTKRCHHCNGSGTWPMPQEADCIHDWLGACVGKAKGQRSGALNGTITSDDVGQQKADRRKPVPEDERGAAAVAEIARRSMGQGRNA